MQLQERMTRGVNGLAILFLLVCDQRHDFFALVAVTRREKTGEAWLNAQHHRMGAKRNAMLLAIAFFKNFLHEAIKSVVMIHNLIL